MPVGNALSWFINNVGNASWWRSKALAQGVTDEGGVDVYPGGGNGTPIYALGTGKLMGSGYFYHGGPYFSTQKTGASNNAPGFGVVTEDVPGVGQVYYQHITIAPSIPFCTSGNCSGYTVQRGQLIGYSNAPNPGIVEVGINAPWGGIWGTNSDPLKWFSDPRAALTKLAQTGGPVVASQGSAAVSGGSTTSSSLPFGLDTIVASLQQSFTNFAEEAAVFIIALILIILGIMLLMGKQISGFVEDSAKVGAVAAA